MSVDLPHYLFADKQLLSIPKINIKSEKKNYVFDKWSLYT